MNPTRNPEVVGVIPGLAQWVKDPALLWLWCRTAAAALIGPLAWETPYTAGMALKRKKKKKKKKKKHTKTHLCNSIPICSTDLSPIFPFHPCYLSATFN